MHMPNKLPAGGTEHAAAESILCGSHLLLVLGLVQVVPRVEKEGVEKNGGGGGEVLIEKLRV